MLESEAGLPEALLAELRVNLTQLPADPLERILHPQEIGILHADSLLLAVALAEERVLESGMTESVDGEADLVQSVDGLVDSVVEDLQLTNVDFRFHAGALPVELLSLVVRWM